MRPAATEPPSVVPRVAVKFHLFRYLDEGVFSYNLRGRSDYGRFTAVLVAAAGRRLTYAEMFGQR